MADYQLVRPPSASRRTSFAVFGNDEPEDAELVIVSVRIDDPQGDTETVDGMWPD